MAVGMGVWIDLKRTILVKVQEDGSTETQVIDSKLDEKFDPVKKPAVKGGYRGSVPYQFAGRQISTHGVHRFQNYLKSYYKEVISNLKGVDSFLLMGPSHAKKDLKAQMDMLKRFQSKKIVVQPASKLTQPQIVAKVKKHFGVKIPRKFSNRDI